MNNERPVHAKNLLPRIGVKLWHFPDKKNPMKEWWGWTIEVFSYDTNNMPVVFKKVESHILGPKSRLWDSEEKCRKDADKYAKEIEERVKAAFDRGRRMGRLKLVGVKSILG